MGQTDTWTRFAYSLDAYAGNSVYVAVQCVSNNDFYLLVDDVTGPAIYYPSTPVASLSAPSLAFGTMFTGSTSGATATVSLTNNGTNDLVYTVASDNAAFTVSSATGTVGWLGSDDLTVTFMATEASTYSGNLIFTHNGSSSPDTVSMSGAGTLSLLAESFDGASYAIPDGWTILNLNGDTDYWYQYSYSYYANTGTGTMRLYTDYNSSNDDWLVTPELSLPASQGYRLSFGREPSLLLSLMS